MPLETNKPVKVRKVYKKASKKDKQRKEANAKKAEEGKLFINERVNRLSNLTDQASASKEFKKWLKVYSKFHNYSIMNSIWLLFQADDRGIDPSRFASYTTWKSIGRQVKKGSESFKVLAPITFKYKDKKNLNKNGDPSIRNAVKFRVAPTFEISQTEGEELPSIDYRTKGKDHGLVDKLERFADNKGIKLSYVSKDKLGTAKGCSRGGEIWVLETLEGSERAGTLAHELGHELLHWDNGGILEGHEKSVFEIEAESVSYVILEHFGIDASRSSFYLAAWNGSTTSIKTSMRAIKRASKEILDFILDTEEEV